MSESPDIAQKPVRSLLPHRLFERFDENLSECEGKDTCRHEHVSRLDLQAELCFSLHYSN